MLSFQLYISSAEKQFKGVILFVNIAPALLVKVGWPYLVKVSLAH